MNIGEPRRVIEVEPVNLPVPEQIPVPEPDPTREPAPGEPEREPAHDAARGSRNPHGGFTPLRELRTARTAGALGGGNAGVRSNGRGCDGRRGAPGHR